MDKKYRTKALTALAAFLALLILSALPVSAEITGEIGIKGTGTDETAGTLNVNREYQSLPQGISASLLSLEMPLMHKRGGYFRFLGTDMGEADVDSALTAGLSRNFTFEGGWVKTPHLLNQASNYSTVRDTEYLRVNLYPLGKLRASYSYSNEDKTGRRDQAIYVGQKTRTNAVDVNGTLGDAVLSVGLSNEDLSENKSAHDMDGLTMTATLTPGNKLFGIVSYDEKQYDPAMSNSARTLELKNMDLAAAYALRRNLTFTTAYSVQKRSGSSTGSLSYEDDYMSFGLNLRSRAGRAGLTYKVVDRDYTGAAITSRKTETVKFKGASRLSFLGLKAEYEHSNRDISGGNSTTLWDFAQLPGEVINQKYSVDLLGFKKFFMTFYSRNNKKSYAPQATYGTSSYRNVSNGFSTLYQAGPNVDFNLDYYDMQNRMNGHQLFWSSDGGGNTQRDLTLADDYDTKFLQFRTNYYFKSGTIYSFDYSTAASHLADNQNNNEIRDRTFSLSVEKHLTPKNLLTAGISRTFYEDRLDSTFSGKSTLIEVEILRKF